MDTAYILAFKHHKEAGEAGEARERAISIRQATVPKALILMLPGRRAHGGQGGQPSIRSAGRDEKSPQYP